MGYEYYIVNETKKQIFGGFKLIDGRYESESHILAYLASCNKDTFRFVGESDKLIEWNIFNYGPPQREYRFIDPWQYFPHKGEEEIERLRIDVNK